MWPFSKRSSQLHLIAPTPREQPVFSEFEVSDVSLKIWLPQVLVDRVNWVSRETGASRPDVIRALLFEHLYGRVAYLGLVQYQQEKEQAEHRRKALPATNNGHRLDCLVAGGESSDIIPSRSRDTSVDLAMLGKSDADLTITLPRRLKQDLATLAAQHKLMPSSYVRKMLVLLLMGEPMHTQWQQAIGKISADVARIESE